MNYLPATREVFEGKPRHADIQVEGCDIAKGVFQEGFNDQGLVSSPDYISAREIEETCKVKPPESTELSFCSQACIARLRNIMALGVHPVIRCQNGGFAAVFLLKVKEGRKARGQEDAASG